MATKKEPGVVRVDNRTRALCTIANNSDELGATIELLPGVNEEVPGWVVKDSYFKALVKAGIVGVLAPDEEPAASVYKLDPTTGLPIQATDEEGELMFDEETGAPIFMPADEE